MALVLAPEPPVEGWLALLGEQISRSPGFFDSRPVILDLGLLPPDQPDVAGLIQTLADHGVRIIGTENAHPGWPGVARWGGPIGPISANPQKHAPKDANGQSQAVLHGRPIPGPDIAPPEPPSNAPDEPDPPRSSAPAETAAGPTLLVEHPVRSGQQILNESGDVTVLGTVAWGAEIIASGSIHIYGALRGRAIAGFSGNKNARIFCRRLEAELLAIDGLYRTAEEWDPALYRQPVQVRLEGETLVFALLE